MFEAELIFGGLVVLWIAYEVFGRNAIEIIQSYMVYIRIAGGIAVIGFLYWHVTKNPENLQDTLGFAKYLMLPSATGRVGHDGSSDGVSARGTVYDTDRGRAERQPWIHTLRFRAG